MITKLRNVRLPFNLRPQAAATRYTVEATLCNAFAGVLIARLLPPSERGYVAVVVTAAGIVGVLTTLGIGTAFRALLIREPSIGLQDYVRVARLLAVGICFPALLLISFATGHLIDSRAWSLLGCVLLLGNGLGSFFRQTTSEAMAAYGNIAEGAKITRFGSAVLLILIAIIWWVSAPHPSTYILLAYAATNWIKNAMAIRSLDDRSHGRNKALHRTARSRLVAHGLGTWGFTVGQELAFRIDRYLIGALADTRSAGLYAVATTPAELLRIPVTVVSQFTMLETSKNGYTLRSVYLRGILAALPACAAVPLVMKFGESALTLIYGVGYAEAAPLLVCLVFAQCCLSPYLVWSRALAGVGSRLHISVGGALGVATVCLFCLALVPQHGALGAAVAVTIGYGTLSLVAGISICLVDRGRYA